MAYVKNSAHQISMFDRVNGLPQYLKDVLEKSWAEIFKNKIFCNINEGRFSVLYSDNPATRPNSPVNVIIGLLLLKELFQNNDEELIGELHFNLKYQYALQTTSMDKQPVSINTITNFRRRLYDYYEETGIDLLQEEIEAQAKLIEQYMDIDGVKFRMDSLVVSSSCKKLSRLELIYSVNERLVKKLFAIENELIPEDCLAYLEKGNKNETIYRTRDSETAKKIDILIFHAIELYYLCIGNEEYKKLEEFKHLERMIGDQTKNEGDFEIKKGKDIASTSLQNPTDPDATYRFKYKGNVGYVANVVQSFDDDNGVITQYDLKPNVYSDQKFSKNVIEKMAEENTEKEKLLIVDGAYYSEELAGKAAEKNIGIIPTEMTGRKPNPEKISIAKFTVDEENKAVIMCPNGNAPDKSYFSDKSYTVIFDKDKCLNCPLRPQCPVKIKKDKATLKFSENSYKRHKLISLMNTEDYLEVSNKRAGVEGIPSVLRRRYKIDDMPIRGLVRSKIWFGFKIGAMNIKSMLKCSKGSGKKVAFSCFKLLIHIIYSKVTNFYAKTRFFMKNLSFKNGLFGV